MKINYNGKEVGKWYHSDAVIPKAYINDNMVFPRMLDSAPPTPEYDVMCSGSISDYTGNAPEVYCFSVNKWYMRTIGGNYTEYGVYATGKSQDPYIGELAIDGGHEWEYTSNGWVDLGKTSRLPQGYTELEYIDSTDVNTNSLETFPAFIQTDYTPNYQSKFEYKAQILKDTEFPRFWGAGYWNNKNGIQMEYESYATGTLRVMWLGDTIQSQSNVNGDFNAHTYVLDRNKMYRDDVLVLENNNGTTLTANSTLAIFTFHDTQYSKGPYYHTNQDAYLYGRMWYFNIYDDDVPVKKYIPAKRNNDNKVGFYDIVNNEFVSAYDGQSRFTTQFIAGPITGGSIVKEYSEKIAPPIPVECCQYEIYTGSTISTYEGAYPQVYILESKKWYMRTIEGNYKEYGVYADNLSTDAYIGELAVYDGHEYEYTASGWVDLGEVQSGGSLPVNVFSLNYNAKHMDGNTFLREEGQLVDADATINGSDYTINDGYVTIGNTTAGNTYCAVGGFQTYMNRNNSNPEITIISKAKTNPAYSNHYSLLCNRGNSYNWMWRPYRNKLCLHGGSGEEGNLSIPQGEVVIGSARVNSSRQLILNDWSNGTTNTTNGFSYGSLESGGFAMFRDYYNRTLEPWSGDFYWVFMCQSTLTDEEVQQVIQYNEEGGIEYIKEYEVKAAPTTAITASTVEELESITCGLFEGMKATVGSDTYTYTNGEWVKLEFTVSGLTKSRTAKTVRINNTDVPIEIGTDPNSDNLYEWYAVYTNKITSLYQFLYNTYNDVVSVGFNEDIDIDQNTSVGMFAYNRSELTSIKWPKGIINLGNSMLNNTKITEFVLNDVDMTIPESYLSINFPSTLTLFDSYNSRVATTNNNNFGFPNVATCSIGKNIIPPSSSTNVFGKMNTVTIHPDNPIYKLSQDGKTIMADGTNNGFVWDKVAYKAVQGITAIPDGVKTLHNYYGQYISINNDITVPQSVTSIENNYALAFETNTYRILLPYYRGILSTSTLYSGLKLDFHNNPYFPYNTGVSGYYGTYWRLYMNGTEVNSFSDNTNNSIKLDRCTSLTTITLSENVNATCSFAKSNNLTTVNIPKTESYGIIDVQGSELLTTVNNAAGGYPKCYGCHCLRNIDLNKATKITNSAFMDTCLGEVTLSGNLTEIEGNGFHTNYGISMILHMQSVVPPTLGTHNSSYLKLPITFVPSGSINAYKTATNWSNIADRIFEEGTFNANDYSTIEIKNTGNIITIYNYLDGINHIYFYPYSYDSQKGTIKCAYTNVKSTDTTLAEQFSVYNYQQIVSVDLGRNNYFTTVGSGMFGTRNNSQTPYLESIVLPPNLTTIKSYAFGYSFNGSNYHPVVNLPDTITTIEQSAFREYKGNINKIPPLVTTIPQNAFWGCQYLNFDFSTSNITSIDNYGFGYSNVQTEVYFPDSLTTIGGYNLYQYNAITKVRLGSNITSIGQSFLFCGNNVSYDVVCEATTPPTLSASNTFNKLVNLYVPDASVDTYKGASGWTSYSAKIKPISEMPVS